MQPAYKIGQQFTLRGKHRTDDHIVIDILTTTNSKGEFVSLRYVTSHVFCGQEVINRDITETTIKRALFNQ